MSTQHPEGLSPDALALLDDGPWPFVSLTISGNEVHDREVLRAVPSMTTIQQISISDASVLTDESLFALTNCPKLSRLDIYYCLSMILAGVNQFHSLRPEASVYFTEPCQRMQTFSSQ